MTRLLHLLRTFREYSCRTAIIEQDISYSYNNLLEEFDRWLYHVAALPIPVSSVIGLRTDYSLSGIGALLALLARRIVPALIPRDRAATEYLTNSHASGLLEIHPDATHTYTPTAPPSTTHPLFEQLRERNEAGFVIFTSGSTGIPKAALHSLERFLTKFDRSGRTLRTLAFLVFDHIAGLDTLFYTLRNGGSLILTQRRDPDAILKVIASHKVEVLPTSPSFLRLLCAADGRRSFDLPSLKVITYGSEPMDATSLQQINQRFPAVQIIQKYGTTELGSPQTVSRSNDSLWLKFKGESPQIKVIDGILWLRSKGTMLGYINAPSPDTNGEWYCTGDLVEVDGEWIRFLGRADDLIKVGGEKVSPSEVECTIRELSFVKDVLVSGEPHPLMGHILAAQVAVAADRPLSSELATNLRQHCRGRLGPHHVPVRITFVPEDSLRALSYRFKAQRPTSRAAPQVIPRLHSNRRQSDV